MVENVKQQREDEEYSSDSEPDEVLKETSKKEIRKLFESEKQAQNAAAKRLKSKRRDEIERNTEQKRRKREQKELNLETIERLPTDLLNEVGESKKKVSDICLDSDPMIEEDDIDFSEQIVIQNRSTRKGPAVKSLTTPSTKFEVLNLDQLNSIKDQARLKKATCYNFRDEMLYGKKHNRRIKTWRVLANDAKRQANVGR